MRYRYHYSPFDLPDETAYRVRGWDRIAFWVLGWEIDSYEVWSRDCQDFEYEDMRTGKVVVQMVGDDQHNLVDKADITPLTESEWCPVCGQIGLGCCAHA